MSTSESQLSPDQVQQLMSQLLDGELSPADASQLNAYLELHPEAIDWMEGLDLARTSLSPQALSNTETEARAQAVLNSISNQEEATPSPETKSTLISFPRALRPLAAAAAVALIGIISWNSLHKTSAQDESEYLAFQGSEVQFVSTDIPDANPIVYTDNETGWTVIWVEKMDTIPEEA